MSSGRWRFVPRSARELEISRMTGPGQGLAERASGAAQQRRRGRIWGLDAVRIWRSTRTQGRHDQAPAVVRLKAGWGRYVITLDGGELTLGSTA
jgi:hypothetical protein